MMEHVCRGLAFDTHGIRKTPYLSTGRIIPFCPQQSVKQFNPQSATNCAVVIATFLMVSQRTIPLVIIIITINIMMLLSNTGTWNKVKTTAPPVG
jgi:hypothetical protein